MSGAIYFIAYYNKFKHRLATPQSIITKIGLGLHLLRIKNAVKNMPVPSQFRFCMLISAPENNTRFKIDNPAAAISATPAGLKLAIPLCTAETPLYL